MSESVFLDEEFNDYEPSQEELEEYACYIGINPKEENDLMWIAREGLKAGLPKNWKACMTKEGEIFYFNSETQESTWEHPLDDHFKEQFGKQQAKDIQREEDFIQKHGLKEVEKIEDYLNGYSIRAKNQHIQGFQYEQEQQNQHKIGDLRRYSLKITQHSDQIQQQAEFDEIRKVFELEQKRWEREARQNSEIRKAEIVSKIRKETEEICAKKIEQEKNKYKEQLQKHTQALQDAKTQWKKHIQQSQQVNLRQGSVTKYAPAQEAKLQELKIQVEELKKKRDNLTEGIRCMVSEETELLKDNQMKKSLS